ncbi:membrane protein [Georgenia halophila]|uniref:Membrane protein n=1 Tax=Georgenia halophila TaxID=620889 RepID=A0ABP8L7Z5_9MICO
MSARSSITTLPPVLGLVLAVAAVVAVIVSAFTWANVRSEPHELPIAVAAPAPLAEQVSTQLVESAGREAFEISTVADRAAAVDLVQDREVYGAVVVGQEGGEILTASAASPAVAQMLTQLAAGVPPQAGGPFRVTDVVPLPSDDPRGIGLSAGLLPLVIAGILTAALLATLVGTVGLRVVGVALAAATGGMATVGVLQGWLGSLEGSYWANSAVAALAIGAVGATLLGLYRLLGRPGLGLGAATMVLLGNPLSAAGSAPEMLPEGWGTLGQLLPPGAAGTALRSVAFFDGAGATVPLIVLTSWLVVGLVLAMLPVHRGENGARAARDGQSAASQPVPA